MAHQQCRRQGYHAQHDGDRGRRLLLRGGRTLRAALEDSLNDCRLTAGWHCSLALAVRPSRRLPSRPAKCAAMRAWCAAADRSSPATRRYDCPMEPPGITRHRRPFLAPLYLSVLVAAVLFALGWAFYNTATTTVVFLVRPVEKALGAIDDPPVSPEGEARAAHLAYMFGGEKGGAVRLDGIYESDDRRA